MEYNAQYCITDSLKILSDGLLMSQNNFEQSQLTLEVMKEFQDCHLSYKVGGGTHCVSFMQSITENLYAGFESMYHPMEHRWLFNYGAKY